MPHSMKRKKLTFSRGEMLHIYPVECDVRRYTVISFVKECLTTT